MLIFLSDMPWGTMMLDGISIAGLIFNSLCLDIMNLVKEVSAGLCIENRSFSLSYDKPGSLGNELQL